MVLFAGCAGAPQPDSQPDLGPEGPSTPDLALPDRPPTDHPPFLKMTYHGGPILPEPETFTVAWRADATLAARVERFTSWMLGSPFMTLTMGELGVGNGRSMGVLLLEEEPPAKLSEAGLAPIVQRLIADHHIAVNANTLFSFVINRKTSVELSGARGCYDFGGFHTEVPLVGTRATAQTNNVPVAVNLQCDATFDSLTSVISHEISEAATDPYPYFRPAWLYDDFGAPLGGENADLCTGIDYVERVVFPDGSQESYVLNPNWTNWAAELGTVDPCQPTQAGRTFFNVALEPSVPQAEMTDTGLLTIEAELRPFSFGEVGPIKWALVSDPGVGIEVEPSRGTVRAGQTIRVILTVDPDQFDDYTNQSLRFFGYAEFPLILSAQSKAGGNQLATTLVVMGSPR
jgi:hypothetical protein